MGLTKFGSNWLELEIFSLFISDGNNTIFLIGNCLPPNLFEGKFPQHAMR